MGSPEAMQNWMGADEETRKKREKEGMQAWMKWATNHKADIVTMGSPLGKTKKIDKDGISDIKNEMGAYTVVQAETQEDAAKMFIDHPHFTIFPGDRVEVMECLPIPGM